MLKEIKNKERRTSTKNTKNENEERRTKTTTKNESEEREKARKYELHYKARNNTRRSILSKQGNDMNVEQE